MCSEGKEFQQLGWKRWLATVLVLIQVGLLIAAVGSWGAELKWERMPTVAITAVGIAYSILLWWLLKKLGVVDEELSLGREFVEKQRADLGSSRRMIVCIVVCSVAACAIWLYVLSPLLATR